MVHSEMYLLIIFFFNLAPPKWIKEPESTQGLHGTNAILDCSVTGYPLPTITWKKINGNAYF